VEKLLPHLVQICFFLTPVAYLSSAVPQRFQWLYYLNPVGGAIDGFRWALLGAKIFPERLVITTLISMFVFISGLFYFRRLERNFADVL
jgi:lipopolysaccharide transport system permease protein